MKKGDIIVVLVALAITGILFAVNYSRNQSEEPIQVEVRVNGELFDTFSIEETVNKVYNTEFGMNALKIENKTVTVSDADCLDQICVDTKQGTGNGDAIVCVPNRFTVELIGKGGDIDAIAR
jgi:hypothetical protein